MEKHVQIVGILHIVGGGLGILIGLVCFVAIAGGGILSADYEAMSFIFLFAIVVGGFFLVLSLPAIVGGIFLMKKANWARILILIISVLNLVNFPLGTAMGVYSFWVLLNADTIPLFSGQATGS